MTAARAASIPMGPLRRALLAWYDASGRRLGFRGSADPYAVLVSEVMAQQTQISRVEGAWRAFLVRFPTISALAAASTGDVLRAWAGLGYNRRALHLQRSAVAVVTHHAGLLPDDLAELEALPGVGPYTSRAVAAICFGRPVGAVDTNVRRVIGRLSVGHGHVADGGSALPSAEMQTLADALVDPERPADWTHALMDLGATVCRPRPACGACPLRAWCAYVASDVGRAGDRHRREASTRPSRAAADAGLRPSFTATSRWLRGRLLATLRESPPTDWRRVDGPLGVHDAASVEAAIVELTREGLVERDRSGRVRLPVQAAVRAAGRTSRGRPRRSGRVPAPVRP